jgi:hypothetical protein
MLRQSAIPITKATSSHSFGFPLIINYYCNGTAYQTMIIYENQEIFGEKK